MSNNKKTILFVPMNALGHINACLGLAQELYRRGHRIVWAIDRSFKDKLTVFGFEEELIGKEVDDNDEDKHYWQMYMEKNNQFLKGDPLMAFEKFILPGFRILFLDTVEQDSQYKKLLVNLKPDLLVIDKYFVSPSLVESGIPWIWIFSAAPHFPFINENKIPPPWVGLPIDADREVLKKNRNNLEYLLRPLCQEVNDFYKKNGGTGLPNLVLHPFSPHLNIYLYPEELDYKELYPLPNNWVRVENFLRIEMVQFEIPEQLRDKSGKLIFLSMGSIGCANLELMAKLTQILSKSKNRFIVSKGPVFDSYELPDNMWGQRFLPQTAILPLVDLVITHGGNNTVTETFYFGKPMLVLPLFFDQLDNAQRVEETGLGLRLNPFHCSEHQLLSAVDRLLSDEGLARSMASIGERIRSSKDKEKVSKIIENIASI